jgi:hypothetical protein
MEFIYFLIFLGALALFGIIWNLIAIHQEKKQSKLA